MSEKAHFILAHDIARQSAIRAVQGAPPGYAVTVAPPSRTLEQNAKLHALLQDVAESGYEWAGRARSADEWKVLFVSAHAMATGARQKVVCGIENEPVVLRESTAAMTKERLSSLIEYIQTFCAEHHIELRRAA